VNLGEREERETAVAVEGSPREVRRKEEGGALQTSEFEKIKGEGEGAMKGKGKLELSGKTQKGIADACWNWRRRSEEDLVRMVSGNEKKESRESENSTAKH